MRPVAYAFAALGALMVAGIAWAIWSAYRKQRISRAAQESVGRSLPTMLGDRRYLQLVRG